LASSILGNESNLTMVSRHADKDSIHITEVKMPAASSRKNNDVR
jgi:hypothetical protein